MKNIFITILLYISFTNISLADQSWIDNLPGSSSPEIIDCLKNSIGEKNLIKYFGSKKRQKPSSKHESMMRKCFEGAKKMQSNNNEESKKNSSDWTKNLPGPPTTPEIIKCLKENVGEKKLIKYFGSGQPQRPSSKDEKKFGKCFQEASQKQMSQSDKKNQSQSQENKINNENCVLEGNKIDRIENNKIIGVFGPSLWEWSRNNSFKNANEIKKTGSNTLGIGLTLFIDKKGKLAFGKNKAPDLNQYLCLVGSALKEANESGLSTYLAVIPQIMSGKKGVERSKLKGKQREIFLDELENILPMIAKFAERHAVNYFSPLSEPEKRIGTKLATTWMPRAPKIIKQHFSGLLVWQSADDYYKGKLPKFEGGYDLFGIIILPSGSNSSEINEYYAMRKNELSKLNKAIKSSGIKRIFAAEFGFMKKPNIKKSNSIKIYYKLLDLIKPYTDEVLFLENPSDMKGGKPQQVNNTFIEEIIMQLNTNN